MNVVSSYQSYNYVSYSNDIATFTVMCFIPRELLQRIVALQRSKENNIATVLNYRKYSDINNSTSHNNYSVQAPTEDASPLLMQPSREMKRKLHGNNLSDEQCSFRCNYFRQPMNARDQTYANIDKRNFKRNSCVLGTGTSRVSRTALYRRKLG